MKSLALVADPPVIGNHGLSVRSPRSGDCDRIEVGSPLKTDLVQLDRADPITSEAESQQENLPNSR